MPINSQKSIDRTVRLLEKEKTGTITAIEELELKSLVPSDRLGRATEAQKQYIEVLLGKLWTRLDFDGASALIRVLKAELDLEY